MLTIRKVVVAAAGSYVGYMAEPEAYGDYYVNAGGEASASPGRWLGKLAGHLGLSGEVSRDLLLAVMRGADPRTGTTEIRIGATGDHVAAHDLTFSAPSSVTAAWVMVDDSTRAAIQRAHDQAVEEAFAHIERTFPLVRRRDRQRGGPGHAGAAPIITERAASVLAARFAHHTARRTATQVAAGLPPDPQLHTHLLLLMAKRQDGRLVALTSLALFQGAAEAGAVYRASLAARLAALGFPIERRTGNGQYFEIAGVPLSLRQIWSRRREELTSKGAAWRARFREEVGRDPTVFEEREWAAKERAPKSRWHFGQLFRHWRTQAAFLGVTEEAIMRLRRGHATLPPAEAGRMRLIQELLSAEGITKEHATFDLRRLRVEAYLRAPGLVAASEVEETIRRLLRRGEVIEVAPGVWTTREMRQLEEAVLAWKEARTTRGAPEGGEMGDAWAHALRHCAVQQLSAEQQVALEALRRGAGFTALVGEAGVGKGVVLRVAADAWRGEGRTVMAAAVSGAQAQRLGADLGEGVQPLTLDALIHRVRTGRLSLGPRDVVAVDEAGQIDTRRWAALAEVLGVDGPRVVAVGDDAQLTSVRAGGLWPHLANDAARLTEVRRTRLEWERDAWAHIRRGESEEGLALYARHRHLDILDTRQEALQEAVSAWDGDGRRGLIVTDANNAERYQANLVAQQRRVERGDLGDGAADVDTPSGTVQLRVHDRVIFKGQYRAPELGRRVENGTVGEVVGAGEAGAVRVRTAEPVSREVELSPRWEDGWLDLHYAVHVSMAQGTTVPRAYVVAGGWQTHKESLYVQLSRSQEGSRIFVDRDSLGYDADVDLLRELASRASQSRAKVAARTGQLPRRPRFHRSAAHRHRRPAWFAHAVAASHAPQEAALHGHC